VFFSFVSCWLSAWYFMYCLFLLFTRMFVTCDIKYQSINQYSWTRYEWICRTTLNAHMSSASHHHRHHEVTLDQPAQCSRARQAFQPAAISRFQRRYWPAPFISSRNSIPSSLALSARQIPLRDVTSALMMASSYYLPVWRTWYLARDKGSKQTAVANWSIGPAGRYRLIGPIVPDN